MFKKKITTRVIFPITDKDGKVKSICGIPVFGFKTYEGKNLKPLAYSLPNIAAKDTKDYEKCTKLRCDLRMVRADAKMEKMFKDNPHLVKLCGDIAGYEYIIVAVMAKDFFISRANYKLAQTWIADSFICSPWNASGAVELPMDLLEALMNERKTEGKLRKAAENLAVNCIIKYHGCSMKQSYDCSTMSDVEYASGMRAIVSTILGVSPKKMILAEHKISKKLTKINLRIVKKVRKVSVSEEKNKK